VQFEILKKQQKEILKIKTVQRASKTNKVFQILNRYEDYIKKKKLFRYSSAADDIHLREMI
jgi:hypothetical protein